VTTCEETDASNRQMLVTYDLVSSTSESSHNAWNHSYQWCWSTDINKKCNHIICVACICGVYYDMQGWTNLVITDTLGHLCTTCCSMLFSSSA